ncbi:MAG: bifunctional serine/threonine-protein kinase/formylglycine-generating enzyme family protein [Gemmataceae bacterium]|nr:bifunctional serine/threonine-protein kinase/formylglycine-generating enzyme family protein [Gemmataceae bacterium]MCI0741519.1 bifunctional serine/threonine-protein kinase/formylglycine-generating enzyme family protein [Gemmataceae bacterium]
MPGPGDLGRLNSTDWNQLQDAANSLEEAWKKGDTVDLAQYLPPSGVATRTTILQELIKTDLECRWRRGQRVGLDYYLEKFPAELGTTQTVPASLIHEEYRVRKNFGDRAPLEQYKDRFPQQFEELQRLAEQDSVRTNASDRLADTNPGTIAPQPAPARKKADELPLAGKGGSSAAASLSKKPAMQVAGHDLLERIGMGGFAEVWKALAPGGILKAIKIIMRPYDQAEAQREKDSMELIKNMRHHFLLSTHSYQVENDRLAIVMDLADGSLRDCLNTYRKEGKSAIPLPELLKYYRQSAEAIDYLHSKRVQHRDIKPENILLVEGNVRVADFGLAKATGSIALKSATFAGTPLYMPPETWNDKSHPNGDQYSLAIAYFELRTGRRLFKDGGLPSLMRAHLEESPNLDPLGEAEQNVLKKALAKNPEDRYSSCLQFVQDLERAVAHELPVQFSATPLGQSPSVADTQQNTIMPGGKRGQSWTKPDTYPDLGPHMPPAVAQRSWTGRVFGVIAILALLACVSYFAWQWFRPSSFALCLPTDAVTVHAGAATTLDIGIQRDNFTEPVHLKFSSKETGLHFEEATIPPGDSSARVTVKADAKISLGAVKVSVQASAQGHDSVPGEFELTVAPFLTLPPPSPAGPFRPVDGEVVAVGNKRYYKHIECTVDGKPVRFVFIPSKEAAKRSYYIMVDKVWNGLFAKFAESQPESARASAWQWGARLDSDADFYWNELVLMTGDPLAFFYYQVHKELEYLFLHPGDVGVADADLPVLRVDIRTAHQFARWLGGFLPTVEQWDTAAGRYEENRGEGPFQKDWQKGEIAINRRALGPMKVGEATKDRSLLECNDMAGNGLEWTRSFRGNVPDFVGDSTTVAEKARLVLRGRDFAAEKPLKFEMLEDEFQSITLEFFPHIRPIGSRLVLAHIGFRVVIEVD